MLNPTEILNLTCPNEDEDEDNYCDGNSTNDPAVVIKDKDSNPKKKDPTDVGTKNDIKQRNTPKDQKLVLGKHQHQHHQKKQKRNNEKEDSTTISNDDVDDLEAAKVNTGETITTTTTTTTTTAAAGGGGATVPTTTKGSTASSSEATSNSLPGRIRRMILPGAFRVPGSSGRTSFGGGGVMDSDYFSGHLSTLSMGNNGNSNTNGDRTSKEFRRGGSGGGGGPSSHFLRPLEAEIVPSREETLQSRINSLTVDAVNVVQVPTTTSPTSKTTPNHHDKKKKKHQGSTTTTTSSSAAGDRIRNNNKKKTLMISSAVIFGILCLAIILPTALLLVGKNDNRTEELGNGHGSNNNSPMMEHALDLLSPITDVNVLLDESTPQHQAVMWLVHDDPSQLFYHYYQNLTTTTPSLHSGEEENDTTTATTTRSGESSISSPLDSTTTTKEQEIVERYVIVLFYFATGGGNANGKNTVMTTATEEDGEEEEEEEEDDGPAPWENKDDLNFLSETSVCEWPPIQEDENVNYVVGIRCNEVGSVRHIRLGT